MYYLFVMSQKGDDDCFCNVRVNLYKLCIYRMQSRIHILCILDVIMVTFL